MRGLAALAETVRLTANLLYLTSFFAAAIPVNLTAMETDKARSLAERWSRSIGVGEVTWFEQCAVTLCLLIVQTTNSCRTRQIVGRSQFKLRYRTSTMMLHVTGLVVRYQSTVDILEGCLSA